MNEYLGQRNAAIRRCWQEWVNKDICQRQNRSG